MNNRVGPILVTGASGFIGQRLVARLRRETLPVVDVGGEHDPDMTDICDLRDRDAVRQLVARHMPETVVHLAAISSVSQADAERLLTWDVNLGGTANLAAACLDLNSNVRFVFASSAEVYGASFLDGPCDEKAQLKPLSAYGRSKAAAEWLLQDLASLSFQVLVARPFNHIGVGQSARFVTPSLAAQIAVAAEAGGIVRVGNLDAVRDFSDVDDLVDALATLVLAPYEPAFGAFNIGSDAPRSIRSVFDRLVELSGARVTVEIDPQRVRPSEIPLAQGVFHAFDRSFGPRKRRSLDDALRGILAAARLGAPLAPR